jgi:hypothetical protein
LIIVLLVKVRLSYFVTTQSAWIIPGIKMIRQRRILIIRSLPVPFFRKTANGGNNNEIIMSTNLLSIGSPYSR